MRQALKRIGLFHQLPQSIGGLVVGRQVAVGSFAEALAEHTTQHQYDLFCPGLQQAPIQSGLHALATSSIPQKRLSIHDERDLLHRLDTMDFAAWHDTQFDTHRPFALRSRAAQGFPISIVHHTLSYPHLLHDSFLRLLLSQPHPYDTVVCTSTASKEVVARLLEHVSTSFNEQYGTQLSYQGRLDVIPLGVDTERFKPREKGALRAQFDLPEEAFILLWVGRLSAIDKADLIPLVHLFADLVRDNTDRELMLV
jgi:glycosyltransferase involved in cell wall biosynthesis